MERIGVREARARFSALVGGKRRVVITYRGRDCRAVVGAAEGMLLERMEAEGVLDEALDRYHARD